ncbi:MAG: sugar ABC transporter substrate-binding protein [Fimbriimonadales bacterium]
MRRLYRRLSRPAALIALFGLVLGLPTACTNPKTGGKIILRVASWGGAADDDQYTRTVRELRKEFERQNPGVEIREEGIPGPGEYVKKLLLSFVAGTEPDIITLDASSAAVFINNGVLLDLSVLIASDREFNESDYWPNVFEIAKRGHRVFAIPGDFTPIVMYYNKRLFDEAGVSYPKPGWTYGDFVETAKALTKPGQFGFKFVNWMPGWITWIWNSGGDVLDASGNSSVGYFDSPKSIEAISFLRDLINVHRVAPSLSQAAASGVDLFTNGQAAMEVSGHWAMIGYKSAPTGPDGKPKLRIEDVGVVQLPTNTNSSTTVMYEAGYAIGKNCKQKELAWKYIKFMTSYAVQKRYNATGIAVSARIDVATEHANNERERAFIKIIPSARPPWGASVEGYENVERVGESAMNAILGSNAEVSAALKDAASKVEKDFKRR